MEIISLKFALFVLVSLTIYYLLPGKGQNFFLLIASYYFYFTWSWEYALILLVLTAFNYIYGRLLARAQEDQRRILWLGVGTNVAILLIFLLGRFYNASLNNLARSIGISGIVVTILLPLGLGYRVLECISYLFDIRFKIAQPSKNFFEFALYLAYFPKLVSGPIERARKFLPQINEKKLIDTQTAARSVMLILVGLVRATVLGGMLTVFLPKTIFTHPQQHTSLELLMGLFVYAFYLYNQFAGYTDIVRGISGLFGIELTRNFAQPIFSKDFSDFWRRWHISLSQWLRDYIYLPLSRSLLRRNPSRSNKANLILPPMATMLASGIWHGASLNLIVWGALNGLYIVAENLFNLFRKVSPTAHRPAWRQVLSTMVILGLALLAAILFRMNLALSWFYLRNLVDGWSLSIPDLRPLIFIGLSVGLDWLQYRSNDEIIFLRWPRWLQASLSALVLIAVIIVYNLQSAPSTFVYP